MSKNLETLKIRDAKIHNLILSEDTGFDDEPIAIMTHTPRLSDTAIHYHVHLSVEEVSRINEWTTKFLAKHKP